MSRIVNLDQERIARENREAFAREHLKAGPSAVVVWCVVSFVMGFLLAASIGAVLITWIMFAVSLIPRGPGSKPAMHRTTETRIGDRDARIVDPEQERIARENRELFARNEELERGLRLLNRVPTLNLHWFAYGVLLGSAVVYVAIGLLCGWPSL